MAKSNAQKCREYRTKQKKLGGSVKLPMPPGTRKALDEIKAWAGHDEDVEALATMIHNIHAAGPEEAQRLFAVMRHRYVPSEEISSRLPPAPAGVA